MSTNPDSLWVCFQLKILTRSFLIDIVLVSMGAFMLVCLIGQTRGAMERRGTELQTYWVEIRQPSGQETRFLIPDSSQTEEQIREDLVRRMIGPPAPEAAVVRWCQETSEIYAATLVNLGIAAADDSPSNESSFRTVSVRRGGNESSADPDGEQRASAWRDYWMSRDAKAQQWLASYEASLQSRVSGLGQSILITKPRWWMPSVAIVQLAIVVGLIVGLLGCVWRYVSPPLMVEADGVTFEAVRSEPKSPTTAAMCFRRSWFRVQQPMSVTLRVIAGWTIVGSTVLAVGVVSVIAAVQ
ncbi:hypothetical protein FHS27_004888 [Rhodopirellula rubra]|uniref:Uncharacterized protein n=1 Tax=Aporhodopirellula rubra TaxID=980271 RepID=A0A7W5E3A6_9BACT|nr:hypothetical protein [Aporhodopirellula rubra]MBB3209052.1 hypothetical protein [Aporhodopirellula rubra]